MGISYILGGEFKEYVNKKEFNIGTSLTGVRYLYVRQISDGAGINSQSSGNVVTLDGKAYHQFGPYIFDNTNPECKIEKNITKITNKNITLKINGTDETSTNNLQYSLNGKDFDENKKKIITTNNTYKAYVKYEAFAKDNVGNIGSCKITISTLVSVPNTKLIINRNLYTVGMLLIISGLGITTYMIIKKKKNV